MHVPLSLLGIIIHILCTVNNRPALWIFFVFIPISSKDEDV